MKALPYAAFLILTAVLPLAAADSSTPAAAQSGKAAQMSAEHQAAAPTPKNNQQDKTAQTRCRFRVPRRTRCFAAADGKQKSYRIGRLLLYQPVVVSVL